MGYTQEMSFLQVYKKEMQGQIKNLGQQNHVRRSWEKLRRQHKFLDLDLRTGTTLLMF